MPLLFHVFTWAWNEFPLGCWMLTYSDVEKKIMCSLFRPHKAAAVRNILRHWSLDLQPITERPTAGGLVYASHAHHPRDLPNPRASSPRSSRTPPRSSSPQARKRCSCSENPAGSYGEGPYAWFRRFFRGKNFAWGVSREKLSEVFRHFFLCSRPVGWSRKVFSAAAAASSLILTLELLDCFNFHWNLSRSFCLRTLSALCKISVRETKAAFSSATKVRDREEFLAWSLGLWIQIRTISLDCRFCEIFRTLVLLLPEQFTFGWLYIISMQIHVV